MGLEDEIDVTDDIGTADAILASSSEMKQSPWIRGVAKFHQLPVFVIKVSSYFFFFFPFHPWINHIRRNDILTIAKFYVAISQRL